MSKIKEQIKELEARQKSVDELAEVIKSLGKMLTDKALQEKVMHYVEDIKLHLENGLTVDDVISEEDFRTEIKQFDDREEEILKTLIAQVEARQKRTQETVVKKPTGNSIVDALSQAGNTKPEPKNKVTSSGLADIDPIRFHQAMNARLGLEVTNLDGKTLGVLHNQDYPEILIKKQDGNIVSINANRVFITNPQER